MSNMIMANRGLNVEVVHVKLAVELSPKSC